MLRALEQHELRPEDVPRALLGAVLADNTVSRVGGKLPPRVLHEGSTVVTNRLVCLLCLLCGGSFESKLELCFAASDVDRANRLTETQAVAFFAEDAAPVAVAAAKTSHAWAGASGGNHHHPSRDVSLDWAVNIWEDHCREYFHKAHVVLPLDQWRTLVRTSLDAMSTAAVNEVLEEDERGAGEFRGGSSLGEGNKGRGGLATSSIAQALAHFVGMDIQGRPTHPGGGTHTRNASNVSGASFASGGSVEPHASHGHGGPTTPAHGVLWQFLDTFNNPNANNARTSPTAGATAGKHQRKVSFGGAAAMHPDGEAFSERRDRGTTRNARISSPVTARKDVEGGAVSAGIMKKSSSFSDAHALSSIASGEYGSPGSPPGGDDTDAAIDIALPMDGAPTSPVSFHTPRDEGASGTVDRQAIVHLQESPGNVRHDRLASIPAGSPEEGLVRDEDKRRAELKASLAAAKSDTARAEEDQEAEDRHFESAVEFVQEIGTRMFLYNIVKMLIIIALVAADASICVWTMFHFGIVTGLSVVMVINVGLAGIFGFFVVRFTNRHQGLMHMEYGQHVMKGLHETINSSALASVGEQLAILTAHISRAGAPQIKWDDQGGDGEEYQNEGDEDEDDSARKRSGGTYSNAV